jgi:Ca2+-binding EF-hand superfamily protein
MIRFDRDGDGKLSFEEFARLITPHGREYQV